MPSHPRQHVFPRQFYSLPNFDLSTSSAELRLFDPGGPMAAGGFCGGLMPKLFSVLLDLPDAHPAPYRWPLLFAAGVLLFSAAVVAATKPPTHQAKIQARHAVSLSDHSQLEPGHLSANVSREQLPHLLQYLYG